MATKLYLHDAANALSGTFPTGEQAGVAASQTATGANTLRTMNTTIGAGQTSVTVASTGTTAQQQTFYRFFCSPQLAAQTFSANSVSVTFNCADAQSNAAMNHFVDYFVIYVWRPSTGSMVGILFEGAGTNATEPTSTNTEQVSVSSRTNDNDGVTAQAGDVLICEAWAQFTQGMNSSYNGTFYYDGTTENTTENAGVSNHASFINFSNITVTFQSNKEIAVGTGSYAITGTAVGTERGRVVAADGGSYAITGADVSLQKGQTIAADAGSYAITGTDAALELRRQVVADAGSYAISGTDVTLTRNLPLAADAGSYAITGADATLVYGRAVTADAGSYAISGTDAALEWDKQIVPDSGAYTITGTDVALEYASSKTIAADAGSYAITGTDAGLELDRVITADAGSYAITGQDVTLVYATAKTLDADSGSYVITGTDVDLTYMPVASTDQPPPTLQGGSGTSAEAEIQAYITRRHARLKQIAVEERKREQAKEALAVEEKKAQAKSAPRKQNEAQKQKRLERIAKYQAQIVALDRSIAEALAELREMVAAEETRQQAIADRRRRLLLVTLAAV